MKKILIVLNLLVWSMVAYGTFANAHGETYPTAFMVVEVQNDQDVLILEDNNGMIWAWEGVEDWEYADSAAAIMEDNNTPDIIDDTILQLHYCGSF